MNALPGWSMKELNPEQTIFSLKPDAEMDLVRIATQIFVLSQKEVSLECAGRSLLLT